VKSRGSSISARGFRLGKLGLSLTSSYLGYQLQNLFLEDDARAQRRQNFDRKTSHRISKELAELKGPVMKLGQILSMQSHLLSPEAIHELATLQMQAPGMHPTLARVQFKASVGKYPEEVFRDFSPEPFAAASLGQVHMATTTRGEKVAVKIQYPGIVRAIENDFKLLRSITLPGRVTGHLPRDILDEVQRGFSEETDYLKEASNLQSFRKALARFSYLSIPRVHYNLTTDKVLTMSFIEGESAGDFLKHKPSQKMLDLIGSRLFELYHYQIQRLGVLHADHQPGNYLFQSDGQVGLVDFGCVKRLSIDFADLSYCCVHRAWSRGPKEAAHICRLIWGWDVKIEKATTMLDSMQTLVDMLFPEPKQQPPLVDFGKPDLLNTLTRCYARALKNKLTNSEFAFVSRTELGLCGLLHQLGSKVNTREIWSRVHDLTTRGHCAVIR
jgi:predicted unusual protein kinase regulating ubiquinone biosynthesis (AarF/ABC1/UbiB family)